ncbi:MAG: hypothetical protein ACUVXF_06855 [Desulfobaccales bacterium]
MSMWFFDETKEMEEYQRLEQQVRAVEREYLELRVVLQEARKTLACEPESDEAQVRVRYLEKRLKGLEEKFPWLLWDTPVEMAFFAPPHG